jgi:hypothetical protein
MLLIFIFFDSKYYPNIFSKISLNLGSNILNGFIDNFFLKKAIINSTFDYKTIKLFLLEIFI